MQDKNSIINMQNNPSLESELDSANINRCKDYWKNELGYGDPEWVDELFKNS